MNTLFPIFVNLKNRLCTVVGGGNVALRKILALLECQASVRVIAPTSIQRIVHLSHAKNIDLCEQPYQKRDIMNSFLVIAATNDAEVNKQIYQDCMALQILCNVVDHPDLCHFYVPAVYTCGDLKIAISTNGISPALAKKIKAELSEMYSEEFLPYLKYLRKIREAVKLKIAEESKRKEILEKIVYDPDFLSQCKNEHFCQEIDQLDFFKEVEQWS
jgi:precorrin-2 dehydrogenase/sirohydrochlorin ferrochelatase